MTKIAIRQSGGANIVSIPKAVLTSLGLHVGSSLELTIKNNQIILTPVSEEMTLESLLAGSPKANLLKTEEDITWLDEKPVGKEEW